MKSKGIVGFVLGVAIAGIGVTVVKEKKLNEQKKNTTKYLALFRQMNQYLVTKQMGKKIESFFEEKNIKTIAIYGMSHIGQRIIDDLRDSDVQVMYGIDQRADRLTYELDIYHPEDELPDVDAIVVTAYDFDEIAELLAGKTNCNILAFHEIIFSL